MIEQFENGIASVQEKHADASAKLLADSKHENNPNGAEHSKGIDWLKVAPAVITCGKAGIDAVALAESGALILLPQIALEASGCAAALKGGFHK